MYHKVQTQTYNFLSKCSSASLLCPEVQDATGKLVAVLEATGLNESYVFSGLTSGSCKNFFLIASDNLNILSTCSAHVKGFSLFLCLA